MKDASSLGRRASRIGFIVLLAIVAMFVGCGSSTRIDAGHVGIRVKLAGSDRGVQNMEVKTGWVIYNPLFEQIVQFPTNVQNIVWTASAHEGRPNVDESITFSSREGVNINADVGLSFHIEPTLAPKLYARFRQNDMHELADGYMRNVIREVFNENTSKMPVQEIYGVGKSKMIADVSDRAKAILGADGIIIDQLTITGTLRLPQNVADAINRAMEATQNAIQSENRVRQVKAEADQAITQATGAAEAVRQKAQGDGDAILIRAKAEARANETIRLSVSPTVLQYRSIERWDGKLPTFTGGGPIPMLTYDVSKFAADDANREKRLHEILGDDKPKVREEAAKDPAKEPEKAPAKP